MRPYTFELEFYRRTSAGEGEIVRNKHTKEELLIRKRFGIDEERDEIGEELCYIFWQNLRSIKIKRYTKQA